MKRAITIAAVLATLAGLGACTPPRSERWEELRAKWPDEADMGGSDVEHRQDIEAKLNFEKMHQAEQAAAEH